MGTHVSKSRVEKQEAWKQHISTSVLVKRLNAHSLGEVEMTPTQIKAAEILLRKTIPDLKAVEMSGKVDVDMTVRKITREIVRPK
jgi:hypothetical protein